MDAGPDALRTSAFANDPPLGAGPVGEPDLGPISPELALVDPELARRARELLPEPREWARARPPVVAAETPEQPVVAETPAQPLVPRRRRWLRTVALAAVIFAAGAASGTFLGNDEVRSPGTTLEVRAIAPTARAVEPPRQAPVWDAALRPPKVSRHSRPAARPAPAPRRRRAKVVWAANVLGVAAKVDGRGVALGWHRPARSGRVVVVRAREGRGGSAVVYRGRGSTFHDPSARPCTGYRYTIVNYDRRGRRSTGVPTSVVTGGCT